MMMTLLLAMAMAGETLQAAAAAKDASPNAEEVIAFPNDPSVVNAQRDLGAKGDGLADDTDALQKGLDISCGINARQTKVLFLPRGSYRITRTLVVKNALGPWLYGESRDGTIIRLADGASDCNSVLRTHPRESGKTSADWFMRNIRNLTIDVGNNPNTDGIRYYATNSGILKNIRVIGHGKIGINAGFLEQSGPNLVQDVTIDGFETGILTQWIWGETLSRVTIRNCRKEGLVVIANAVGVEDLVVENTPLAVRCDIPNNWPHWGGVIALVGGRFTGGNPDGPAILNESVLYARDVKTQGFKMALQSSTKAGNIAGADIDEYSSHEVKKLFDAPDRSLRLPIQPEPKLAWETDPSQWVCINDFGAIPGDNKDDTAAIQKAIDAAAAEGKTTVYFRGVGGGDPNWYNLNGEVRIHGSVRHILGLGFGRVLGARESAGGRFIISDDSAPIVKFQNIDSFGGPPATVENRSASRTMVVESCGVTIVGNGGGDIFATDCPAHVHLQKPGQKLWARQLNPEGTSDAGIVTNCGGDLWTLGIKHEGEGVRYRTEKGGRTEILGLFCYDPGNLKKDDVRPMFDIDNALMSIAGLREITFGGSTYPVKVRERRGDETRTLGVDREGGWIGWSLYSGSQQSGR
ncbi:MAG: glycosyl hydrolase family 28-related protein [Bacillota bacterium]